MSNQELVNTESNEVATAQDMGAWGTNQVSSKDIVIPRILAMQGLSELVAEEKAKMGDFVDSLTEEVIGNIANKPVEVIPFALEKVWRVFKLVDGQKEYEATEPVTAANEGRQYEERRGNDTFINEYTMNFYVLRPEDTSLPYIVSFKGTSSRAGKVLATQMYVRNAAAGKVPPAFVMNLSGTKDKNDKGTYVVLSTSVGRETTADELSECLKWFNVVNAGKTRAHEEESRTADTSAEERF